MGINPPAGPLSACESNWSRDEPYALLRCLNALTSGRIIAPHLTVAIVRRKLQLYYCACCRLRWAEMPSDDQRSLVEMIERQVDGVASRTEWATVRGRLVILQRELRRNDQALWLAPQQERIAHDRLRLILEAVKPLRSLRQGCVCAGWSIDPAVRVAFLRELFSNPFHPILVDFEHITQTVRDLAHLIHHDHRFELMPVLADALMDAGCDNAAILDHCLESGNHIRGCWLLDQLLGEA